LKNNYYKYHCHYLLTNEITDGDGKGFEICTAGLEFESGRAPLVRAWDSWGFTPSPGPTKCTFREGEVSSNKKKKEITDSLFDGYILNSPRKILTDKRNH